MSSPDPNPYDPPAADDLTAMPQLGREAERESLAKSQVVLLLAYCAAGAMTVIHFLHFLIGLRTMVQYGVTDWRYGLIIGPRLLEAVLYAVVWVALGRHRQAVNDVVEKDQVGLETVCQTHMWLWKVIIVWSVPYFLLKLYQGLILASNFH